MKRSIVVMLPLVAACPAPSATDTADVDTSDVDTDVQVTAACQPVEDATVPSRAIGGATWSCDGDDCILSLPASEPTRDWARMRVASDAMILDAWDSPELIVASNDGVFALNEPGTYAFDVGQGAFWIARSDDVVAVDGAGTIIQRCPFPDSLDALQTIGVVAGRLLINGLDAQRGLVAVQATDTGWEPIQTEISAWRYREYADNQVLVLGYGYFEWRNLDTGASVLNGGSDDDFSRAAICADGNYWVGGGTGRIVHCTAAHECEYIEADVYPFQAEAYGCDEDGDLWWLEHPDRGLLTTGGVWSYDPMPAGMRTGTEQAGRRWTVVDAE